jgi:hypothetical protein
MEMNTWVLAMFLSVELIWFKLVQHGKIVLTTNPLSLKHGTHSDGTLPDGVNLTEDLDGKLDVDSKQLMTGQTFQELETIQIFKEVSKSRDQAWKELASLHLENHASQIHHSAPMDLTQLAGLESTWTQMLATSMDNSTSLWRPKTQTLSSSSLWSTPIPQEIHGKKSIFTTFSATEEPNRTFLEPQSCNLLISWQMPMQPIQVQYQQPGQHQISSIMELFTCTQSTGIQITLKSYAME